MTDTFPAVRPDPRGISTSVPHPVPSQYPEVVKYELVWNVTSNANLPLVYGTS